MDPSLFLERTTVELMGLICHYCGKVPKRPTDLLDEEGLCNHVFCETCLDAHKPTVCPQCNRTVSKIIPDQRMAVFLKVQRVKCPNHDKGCIAVGMLGPDEAHLQTKENFFDVHQNTCEFEREQCAYCFEKFFPSALSPHQQVCPKVPVDCKFVRFGCVEGKQISRDQGNGHDSEFHKQHFVLLAKAFVEKVPDFFSVVDEAEAFIHSVENLEVLSPVVVSSPPPPPPATIFASSAVEASPSKKKKRKKKTVEPSSEGPPPLQLENGAAAGDHFEEGTTDSAKKRSRAKTYKFGEELSFSKPVAPKATRGRKRTASGTGTGAPRGRPPKVPRVDEENGVVSPSVTAISQNSSSEDERNNGSPEVRLVKELRRLLNYIENALPWDATDWRVWKEKRPEWEKKVEGAVRPKDFVEPIWQLNDIIKDDHLDRQKMLTANATEDPCQLLSALESAIEWDKANVEWYPKWRLNFLTRLHACQDLMTIVEFPDDSDVD
eukprot:TRINITY_DN13512_c1_g1_i4.p1 TRINITY_DN13512_c1_g1~~TRINITY_DN13512_c1_g1_i4.p1  ORF type:complete len:492 (-),score=129.79 TRINITY_DN13512_c1_g1_i4:88-1563(-)